MNEKENSQSDMLSLIIERPALYLGHGSVERTRAFLDGYTSCLGSVDEMYRGFNDWVAQRFGIQTTHDWSRIISFIGMSEANSFQLLRELWEEYKQTFEAEPKR